RRPVGRPARPVGCGAARASRPARPAAVDRGARGRRGAGVHRADLVRHRSPVRIAPAIAAARGSLTAMLKESGRGSSGSRASQRARGALVIAELALAMLLLVGAGLLVRSFS